MRIVASFLRLFTLLLLAGPLMAQCPEILGSAATTGQCAGPGACTLCPAEGITLSVTAAANLPDGGSIDWYYNSSPGFNPYVGEGTFLASASIGGAGCAPQNGILQINEVMSRPSIADGTSAEPTTGEYIELLGVPGTDVGCYVLTDGDWTLTLPAGTTVPADGLLVIGYAAIHGAVVDVDPATCACTTSWLANDILIFTNSGEYLALFDDSAAFIDGVVFGSPTSGNAPPSGQLGSNPYATAGLPGCPASVSVPNSPAFGSTPLGTPDIGTSFVRLPDYDGDWGTQVGGSIGACNAGGAQTLPIQVQANLPAALCGQTVYVLGIINPHPDADPFTDNGTNCETFDATASTNEFVFNVDCPQGTLDTLICAGDSLLIGGVFLSAANPSTTLILPGADGCDSTVLVTVTEKAPMSANLSNISGLLVCTGSEARLRTNIFNGTAPYTLTLNDGTQDLVFANLNAVDTLFIPVGDTTTFSLVSVSDSSLPACENALNGSVTINTVTTPSTTMIGDTICPNTLGQITFVTLGDDVSYDVVYSNGLNNIPLNGIGPNHVETVFPSSSTTYTLVSVGNGQAPLSCNNTDGTDTVEVIVLPTPTASLSGAGTFCEGGSADLSVSFTGTAPFTFTLRENGLPIDTITTMANPHTITVSPGGTANYTLINFRDASCPGTVSGSALLSEVAAPTASFAVDSICIGGTASLSFSIAGGDVAYDVVINDGTGDILLDAIADGHVESVMPSATTTYTLVSVANDQLPAACLSFINQEETVLVRALPAANLSGTQAICSGAPATLNINVLGSAPFTYVLNADNNPVDTITTMMAALSYDAFPQANTVYSITAVADAFCADGTSLGTATVDVTTTPEGSMVADTSICSGESANLVFNIVGADVQYDLVYSNGNINFAINNVQANHVEVVTPGNSTSYTLISVSNSNLPLVCTSVEGDVVDVTVNATPTASVAGSGTFCSGTAQNLTVNLTGTAPFSFEIWENGAAVDTIVTSDAPYLGSVILDTTAAFTIQNLTDANGCPGTSSGSANFTVIPSPTASIVGDTVCAGQSASLGFVSLGSDVSYDLVYSDGLNNIPLNGVGANHIETIFPTNSSTYTLVSVANGQLPLSCTQSVPDTATVLVNPLPTASLGGSTALCSGDSAALSLNFTGIAPFNVVLLANGQPLDTLSSPQNSLSYNVGPMATTLYTLQNLTDANCNGTVAGSATVSVVASPSAQLVADTVCAGEMASLGFLISGGDSSYDVVYNDGTNNINLAGISAAHIENLMLAASQDFYLVSVANANLPLACVQNAPDTASMVVNPLPTALISGNLGICSGDTALLDIVLTGTAPFRFEILENSVVIDTVDMAMGSMSYAVAPTASAIYALQALSDANCAGTVSGTVVVAVVPTPSASIQGDSICGGETANLQFLITGGDVAYNLSYTDGSTTVNLNNIPANHIEFLSPSASTGYTLLSVSNATLPLACADTTSSEGLIFVHPQPLATVSGGAALCAGDTAVASFALSGTAPFTLEILANGQPLDTVSVSDTIYTLAATPTADVIYTVGQFGDANCANGMGMGQAAFVVSPQPTVQMSTPADSLCLGTELGLDFAFTGTAPFVFVLTGSDGTNDTLLSLQDTFMLALTPTASASYTVSALSDAACAASGLTDTLDITVLPTPIASWTGDTSICAGGTANLLLSLSGGEPYFNIVYADENGFFVAVDSLQDGETLPLSPSASTDYVLIAAGYANLDPSCTTLFNDTVAVEVFPLPTATLTGGGLICVGDTADIDIVLTGEAPFSFVVAENGQPIDTISTMLDTFLYQTPVLGDGDTYEIISLEDANCVNGTASGTATYNILQLPQGQLAQDNITICEGQDYDLDFSFSGIGPFTAFFWDGADTVVFATATGNFTLSQTASASTQQWLIGVIDNQSPNCGNALLDTVGINVLAIPQAFIIDTICNPTNTAYQIELGITGGDAASYAVTGSPGGLLVDTTFISAVIPNAQPFSFTVSDGNNCGQVTLSGVHDCTCVTDAGTMTSTGTTLTFCEDELASVGHNGDQFLQPFEDVLRFVLHDGSANGLGNILATATTPSFAFQTGMAYNQVYYITAVAGDNDGSGGVDYDDTCLEIAEGTPISFSPSSTASLSGPSAICLGEVAHLVLSSNGTGPFNVIYSDGTAQFQQTGLAAGDTIFAAPAQDAVYTLISVSDQGAACAPSIVGAGVSVSVNAVQANAQVASDFDGFGVSCFGGNDGDALAAPTGGSLPYSFAWSNGAAQALALNLEAGTYSVTVTDGIGCQAEGSVTLTAPPALTFAASSEAPICYGDQNGSITVTDAAGGAGDYTYSIDGENFRVDSIFPFLAAGAYEVSVQDANGCVIGQNIVVASPLQYLVDLGPDVLLPLGDSLQLVALTNFTPDSIGWSPATGLSCTDCLTPWVTPLDNTFFSITLSDSLGCSVSDEVFVRIDRTRPVFLPNVFSPDNDGTNDQWIVFGGDNVAEIEALRIFDRWGNLVWSVDNFPPNDPAFGWDGTMGGQAMNPGVFVYYVDVRFVDGQVIRYEGDITLLR